MDKTPEFSLLAKVRNKSSLVYHTLEGFRLAVMRALGITDMPLVMDDDIYNNLRKNKDYDSYPFGYFRVSSFRIIKERQAVKTLARHGMGVTFDELTNGTVSKSYLFNLELQVELHLISNDFDDVITAIEKVGIIASIDKFSFQLTVDPHPEFVVSVELQSDDVSFPTASKEEPAFPNAFDIPLQFKITTRCGVSKAVPKINNEGKATTNISVKGDTNE